MTQGRRGSLALHRMTLSFTTPRRFSRRTGETEMIARIADHLWQSTLFAGGVARHARAAAPVQHGRELDMLRRLEQVAGVARPIALVASDTSLEPGVFGIVRPVLLWPRTINAQLDDRHVESILTHEVIHVRRRDNLAAA